MVSALPISDTCEGYLNEMIDCYRYLRNRVADSDLPPESVQAFIDKADQLAFNVDCILSSTSGHKADSAIALVRVAVQFLANAATRQETAETYRKAAFRRGAGITFLIDLLEHQDEKLHLYGSMLVYNCLRDPDVRDYVIGTDELIHLIFELANSESGRGNEWNLFTAQMLLAEEDLFIETSWPILKDPTRYQILQMIQNGMLEKASNNDSSTPMINEKNVSALASVFVEGSSRLAELPWPVDDFQLALLAAVLETLCQITAFEDRYLAVKEDSRVLESVLTLLKLSKPKLDQKEELDKLASPIADGSFGKSPSVNFRTHLVRLLANICYKHPGNRSLMQQHMGIALILDSTPLDANNAFITEWSVFALRNLLEGCPENQQIVKGLQPQGFASKEDQELGEKVGMPLNGTMDVGCGECTSSGAVTENNVDSATA